MERTLSSGLYFGKVEATPAASAAPLRLLANLMVWQRRIASRHQLARLDSRLLADAGISEAQRYAELSKPFWR
ncbi:MAG: DUF1127 domain-containing protein [Pseudomonas sp.]|uniref:DUF1127 domain-containing protein n=1 Tax=Pseudomonas sp. TaxID=306 RepID=UPI003399C85F